MKCRKCSKLIPDGFTDCPWCGASSAAGDGAPSRHVAGVEPSAPTSAAHDLVIAMSIVSSALLFVVLNYFAMVRSAGALTLANSGYFLGRCVGALLVGALIVLAYRKIRGVTLRLPVQALIVLTISSLVTVGTLAIPARTHMAGIDEATIHRYSDEANNNRNLPKMPPAVATKWDPAGRALLKDIAARNQQYISEISALDQTAKPLYTPQSFRDAATVQQMIDQLHARMAVADKYTDWQPVFSRMKDYVATVDASEEEKRKFLAGYEATLPNTLAACKAISDKEHAWLQASLDLYQFTLSKDGAYVWHNDNLAFAKRADSNTFRQKFLKARMLNTEFLKAYWQVRQAEEAMMAQLGLGQQAASPDPSRTQP
jgi:hypothetical protein